MVFLVGLLLFLTMGFMLWVLVYGADTRHRK